ncbi:MAG: dienelactone hydrolase family protein [Polaromonas sp.]|nr:dienelactone hydrolase family protein [Polaromonas sp.]
MGTFIDLKAADGFSFPAYVAEPQGQAKGGMVVLQEIFGVNSHIRDVADRFAAQGYVAIAPALFERIEKGVDIGYNEATMKAGIALKAAAMALPGAGVMQDIQASIDHAAKLSGRKVGIVGFCWGGFLAWRSATMLNGLSAAVPYYGGGMVAAEEVARQPKCPVLAHFSDHDHSTPMEGVDAFIKAHPEVTVHLYNADHGFNCDQRGAYQKEAADQARERTLAFLAEKLA